ncbi:TMEM223 isoform 2, partial [Pongo abelii]
AAPWRRWPAGLLAVMRPLPTCRPLQGATLQRDVLLFEHDRGRFFTILGLFCAGQGVFWASMAVAAVSRPPVPVQPLDAEVPNRGPFDLRSALWRYGLAVGCGAIGYGTIRTRQKQQLMTHSNNAQHNEKARKSNLRG